MKWYRVAADRAYKKAIAKVGYFYEKGMGVPKDYTKAKEWYIKGARLGNGYSQERLGKFYMRGWAGEKDVEKALEWFKKASHNGRERAYYEIGLIHEEQQKYSQAIRWYLLSAIKGYNFGLKRAVYLVVLYPVISLHT